MRIDYARGCFSDNELESAYVRREWRRTTSTFAVTIVILIAALTVLASLCESDATWWGRTRQRDVHDLHGVVGVDRGAGHHEPVRVRTYCIRVCAYCVAGAVL